MGARESWLEEKQSAFLYGFLADVEKGTQRENLFRNLGNMAEQQAKNWVKLLQKEHPGAPLPEFTPGLRVHAAIFLIRKFGPRRLKPLLASLKIRGLSVYSGPLDHAAGHEMPRSISEVGSRHKITGSSGNIRAAVFGINDGLVSNASLIVGVAAASSMDPHMILISGGAGLLAGALSMACGEYVSVRSQRELLEYQLDLERAELEEYPEEEAAELALIYEARGVPLAEAQEFSKRLVQDKEKALHTLAREELGLDPNELGSPWDAALASFAAFSVGGVIPLFPFLLSKNPAMFWISLGASGCALFATGAIVSLFSGRSLLWSGARMLLIGSAAAGLTYLMGATVG